MKKLVQDVVYYREDGTVSSVSRTEREFFATPSGRDTSELVESRITVEDHAATLGLAEAKMHRRVAELEEQIVTEREGAAVEKKQLHDQITKLSNTAENAGRIIGAVLQADAEWNAKMAPLLKFNAMRKEPPPPSEPSAVREGSISK